ncbi:MAG: hypothetical protein ACYTFY_22200, partial [Planctomycetota bacterium]
CGLVVDSKNQLWALTCNARLDTRELLLSCWKDGAWETVDLAGVMPEKYNPNGATLTIDSRDHLHLAVQAPDLPADTDVSAVWGHPSTEVFHITTDASGSNAECTMVSNGNKKTASWHPSISMPQIRFPIEKPVILYTHGAAGVGCMAEDLTEVYCVLPEAD